MTEIEQVLTRLFDRHRIFLWTDVQRAMEAEYNELWLPGVEKITVAGDEFDINHRILREKPGANFLLYRAGLPPDDLDNCLLDVELAAGTFRADQAALWLLELGLGQEIYSAHRRGNWFTSTRVEKTVILCLWLGVGRGSPPRMWGRQRRPNVSEVGQARPVRERVPKPRSYHE